MYEKYLLGLFMSHENIANNIKLACGINEDLSKLVTLALVDAKNPHCILSALKEDKVVLIKGATQSDADSIIFSVAKEIGLAEKLETEAGFASIAGHRENLGKYFMTVNKRTEYQFIPPHSEGSYRTNMQLASFFSIENTTDGGETILFNLRANSSEWDSLREVVTKCDIGNRKISQQEIMQAKLMLNISIPEDVLVEGDVVLSEKTAPAPGIKLYNVLAPLKKTRSVILNRDCYVYWDSVASLDFDSGVEYFNLLKSSELFKEPGSHFDLTSLDNAYPRRLWSSGVNYGSLFESKITRKLVAGDLVIMNNLTWAHSTNNWTPESGQRKVSAAFA
jgi:alpha-ketoglutarate-dependent taurine dioxygenase